MNWDLFEIAELCARGIREEDARLSAEQAVRGVDALDEVAVQALVRDGIALRYAVAAEQRYPVARARRRRSEGERCDIVVLPGDAGDGAHLIDPMEAGTLFAGRGVHPRDALWLEVKCVWQHAICDGVARANPAYATQLVRLTGADVRKLAREDGLSWAAVVIVAFHATAAVAEHDLGVWRARMIEQGLSGGTPIVERFAIADRIGNGVCSVVVAPVRERPAFT